VYFYDFCNEFLSLGFCKNFVPLIFEKEKGSFVLLCCNNFFSKVGKMVGIMVDMLYVYN